LDIKEEKGYQNGSKTSGGHRTGAQVLPTQPTGAGIHNVLSTHKSGSGIPGPPQEGEEITFRTRNHQIDLIIRSCLKIYTTQVLYKGLDIIVIMAFLS